MENIGDGESEESSSSSSSFMIKEKKTSLSPLHRNAHTMHLLLHEILPYSRLGVLQNQFVVSPPLALVAVAPEVRVYCEENAPYSLGGTWWLAHTATHCVVRCRKKSTVHTKQKQESLHQCSAGESGDDAATDEEDENENYAPEGVEEVFTCSRHRNNSHDVKGCSASAECRGNTTIEQNYSGEDRYCWVSEEALVEAQQQQQRQRRRRQREKEHIGGVDDDDQDSFSASGGPTVESFIARNTGTEALVPPQLSSNRRLLSFVRGVPPSFLGFCIHAAQHGWHSATRALLAYTTTREARGAGTGEGVVGPSRLFVVHTQLYAICGYPESRIAHSMWWCLRRSASAMGPASLSLDAIAESYPQVTYVPSLLHETAAHSSSDQGDAATQTVFAACCNDRRTVKNDGVAPRGGSSTCRYRSFQQNPSLRAALQHSRELQTLDMLRGRSENIFARKGRSNHSRQADPSERFSSERAPSDRDLTDASAWMVTNACSLIVSGDITFWSGTFSIDASSLLEHHWYPFFRPMHRNDVEGTQTLRHSIPPVGGCEEASEATQDATAAASVALPTAPPCALFIDGKVVLAVEHKLHRDATHAREAARLRAAASQSGDAAPGNDTKQKKGSSSRDGLGDSDNEQEPRRRSAHTPDEEVNEEEEVETADVQPLFFDMEEEDDAPPSSQSEFDASSSDSDDVRNVSELVGRQPQERQTAKGKKKKANAKVSSSTAPLWYNRKEERFLDEIAQRQAFQLLHCVDVTYLRLPLGPELVAEKPMHAAATSGRKQHEQRTGSRHSAEGIEGHAGDQQRHQLSLREREDGHDDVWDARWLSCLFPRVQMLDLEGPPSVTHASSFLHATHISSSGGGGGAGRGRGRGAGAASPPVRIVRPRGLTLALGAAAAAQTRTTPLYTMTGLWRLPCLRNVVLRAYPFHELPSLVVPSAEGNGCCSGMTGEGDRATDKVQDEANSGRRVMTMRRQPRTLELSVMGWPYVNASGLLNLAAPVQTLNNNPHQQHYQDAPPHDEQVANDEGKLALTKASTRAATAQESDASHSCSAPRAPDVVMLSLTHMDALSFVDALLAVFPPPVTAPPSLPHGLSSSLLPLHALTQLELSKTRVTTAALERMNLPRHTPLLRVLRLSFTPVDSVTSLVGLTLLRVLNLTSTRITRRGLRYVQWMPALEELFLTQCEGLCEAVTDAVSREDDRAASGQRDEAATSTTPTPTTRAVNIFSLQDPTADWEGNSEGGRTNVQHGSAATTFPALRVLDLSNNPLLTERALYGVPESANGSDDRFDSDDAGALSEDDKHLPLRVGVTQYTYSGRVVMLHGWDSAVDRAPMPQLETLFLMQTAVAHLDCLLTLCPRLRVLDVSFTPLREDGLWARVRCPRLLPLQSVTTSDAAPAAFADRSTHPRNNTTSCRSCVYAVRFPPPLRLRQLNLSGTPLASLHPLSCAPPHDWCYTARSTEKQRDSGVGGRNSALHADVTKPEVETQKGKKSARPELPELLLLPHPRILEDVHFDVQLRTQRACVAEMANRQRRNQQHRQASSFYSSCFKSHRELSRQTPPRASLRKVRSLAQVQEGASLNSGAGARESEELGEYPVKVADPVGYTISVDAFRWLAAAATNEQRASHTSATATLGHPFTLESQWTPAPPPPFVSSLVRDYPSPSPHRTQKGGYVRYGAVQLLSTRQLRLGHSSITASGLAAGYGMPQQHRGETPVARGLQELTLRGTSFLCPPYPEAALRGEVPAVVAMALHANQREAAPAVPLARPPPLPEPAAGARISDSNGGGDGGSTGAARVALATSPWSEAEALCAVLRLHRETLNSLDVSQTSVALTTFFHCVYDGATTPREGQDADPRYHHHRRHQHHHHRRNPSADVPLEEGSLSAFATDRAASEGSLHWPVGTQWEDVLTEGPMTEAADALTALLTQPSRVLRSHLKPPRHTDRFREVRRKENRQRADQTVSSLSDARAGRRHAAGGVLGFECLRSFDAEDTPLSTSLKRLFPRLYHCVRDAQRAKARELKNEEDEQVEAGRGRRSASGERDQRSGSGSEREDGKESALSEEISGAEGRADDFRHHHDAGVAAWDTDSVGSMSDTAEAEATAHTRRGPIRMRAVWMDWLHELFGEQCSVQY